MDIETLRTYCISKNGVTESFPFDNDTLVFKVGDKIFLLAALNENPLQINVKCQPEKAIELRERYPNNVFPGYHMNKKHWNTISLFNLSSPLIMSFIDESYQLVFQGLSKTLQNKITA